MTPIKILTPEEMKMEPNVPKILYKYRNWSDDNHKAVLKDQIVYLSSPGEFEDPVDCKIPIRYDNLTNDELYRLYLKRSKDDYPNRTRQEHRKHARDRVKSSPLKDPNYIKEKDKEFFEDFFRQMGVLSLTADPANFLMWQKYSDDHKGFCVGFNMVSIYENLGGGGEVGYFETLPTISPFLDFTEQHYLQVLSKEKKWEFEKEYRTYSFLYEGMNKKDRLKKLPKDCFKQVIFGAKMPEIKKKGILKVCKDQELRVDFLQERINSIDNSVKIEPL